jgi:hypothetical protein
MGCCERNNRFRGPLSANLVSGKLDTEVPSNPHLICSKFWTILIMTLLQDLCVMDLKCCGLPEFTRKSC